MAGVLGKTHEQLLLERVGDRIQGALGVRVNLDQHVIGRWSAISGAFHPQETGQPGVAVLVAYPKKAKFPEKEIKKAVSGATKGLNHYTTVKIGAWKVIVWQDRFQKGKDLLKKYRAEVFG